MAPYSYSTQRSHSDKSQSVLCEYACALNFVGTLFYIFFSLLKCIFNGLFKPVEGHLNKTLLIKFSNDASWSSLQDL